MGKNDQQEKQPSGKPSTEAVGSALQPKADNGIQEWFATLSIEERAGALGFSDGAILRVLLDYASLASPFASKLEANPESRTDKKDSNTSLRSSIWCMMVSIDAFEASIPNSSERGDNGKNVANGEGMRTEKVEPWSESSISSEKESIIVDKNKESGTVSLSDAYRIRVEEAKSPPSSVKDCDDSGKSTSNPLHSASSIDAGTKMMNNICIIFFSSNKLNDSDAAEHVYITLHPSYLRALTGSEVISTLDEILIHAIPNRSHLATPFEASWESLRNAAFHDEEENKVSIPLYALVILRMKSAIFESYRRSTEKSSCSDKSDATIPAIADSVQAADNDLDLSSLIFECQVRLSSLPETEDTHLLRLSKGGQCLLFPFHVLLRELNQHTSNNSAVSTNDAVTRVIQSRFDELSRDDSHKQLCAPSMPPSKPHSNIDDSPKLSFDERIETIPDAAKANEQVSRPTGAGKKKKRKKKKRKGSNGQSQNGGGKLQASMTKQQKEDVSQPTQEDQVPKTNSPFPSDSIKAEKEKETVKQKDLGKGNSTSTIPLANEPKLMVIKPDISDIVVPESQECKAYPTEDDSDSEDDEKTESIDKDAADTTQQVQESMNSSRKLGQNIIAGLSRVADIENDDSGEWETVEVKGRGNRKKAAERANQNRSQSHQHGQTQNGPNSTGSKKSKASRNSNRKQRANMRKMVRDILSNVLDRVEEDVQKRRQARLEPSHSAVSNWSSASAPVQGKGTMNGSREMSLSQTSTQPKDMSMRDIIVGGQEDSTTKESKSPVRSAANRSRQRDGRSGQGQIRRGADGFMYREKTTATGTSVDQNTVPTLPETLSAVSMATSARNVTMQGAEIVQGDTSSGDSGGGSKPGSSQIDKELSPPLPTLLSPENANSASSSVASSLDTSHAGHQSNHIASQQGKEKDVGYHLLDVCDRLTRDINIFMKRREYALDARRRERGAVLMALQGTVSSIWPNLCNVEMYGSCATQLDLPSSDLDVVVTGLYTSPEKAPQSSPNNGNPRKTGDSRDSSTEPKSNGSASVSGDIQSNSAIMDRTAAQHAGHPHPSYSQLSQNAERIIRLAVELERQPWAVHVKAIPTASVPVIKILADPTRISGNGEWLMQAPSLAEASAVSSNERGMMEHGKTNNTTQTSMPPFASQQAFPWRGADVMNGLLKVDITFEGPEHGGIGSTKFSSRVVKEFCNETGLPQDSTPAVQALMVVKELLAQRRLNEPFSGGLSSYALLLLVISVLRERAIICQELERVERQRQLVAAENVDQRIGAFPLNHAATPVEQASTNKKVAKVTQSAPQKANSKPSWNVAARGGSSNSHGTNKNGRAQPIAKKANVAPPAKAAPSSWASIAMKSSSQTRIAKVSKDGPEKANSEKKASTQQPKTVRKASSFADAVANGRRGPKQTSAKAGSVSQPRKSESQRGQKNKPASPKPASEPEPRASSQSTPQSNASSVPSPQVGAVVQSQADEGSFTERRSMFPQGFHDVTEVLCSGETTAGKLLMHFLLFYGQHFDSQSTAIDYSGTHEREMNRNNGFSVVSPYMRRRSGGSYDPMTGMLTVDPIVVYDPLEGAEMNNVARSCFAWSSIRWVFAQSYLTLLSTVEINQNHASGQGGNARGISRSEQKSQSTSQNENELSHPWNGPYGHDKSGNMMIDASSPLLELLLSF